MKNVNFDIFCGTEISIFFPADIHINKSKYLYNAGFSNFGPFVTIISAYEYS